MCVESLVPSVRGEPCGAQGDMTEGPNGMVAFTLIG